MSQQINPSKKVLKKKIDLTLQLIVFGYIRSFKMNIPKGIMDLILLFYYLEKKKYNIPTKIEDINYDQFRYMLQYVLVDYNNEKREKNRYDRILKNDDEIIKFLCTKNKKSELNLPLNGTKLQKMNKIDFANLMYDNDIDIRHCQSMKIIQRLRDYKINELPLNVIDIDLPFIFKQAIKDYNNNKRNINKKDLDSYPIISTLRNKTFDFMLTKQFGEFMKETNGLSKGITVRVRKNFKKYVENNISKYFHTK